MKRRHRDACLFAAGALTTAVIWVVVLAGPESAAPPAPPVPRRAPPPRDAAAISALLSELEQAETNTRRLELARRLEGIPSAEMPAILASIDLVGDHHRLTLAASALLIEWASDDSPAAVAWAWANLRDQGLWDEAFKEIGPAWAWRDPHGFAAWLSDRTAEHPATFGDFTRADAEGSDQALIDGGMLTKACGWLLQDHPRLAFELFLQRKGWSTADAFMWKSLTRPEQIQEALSALGPLDSLKEDGSRSAAESYAISLLNRWREIDPEGFERSAHAGILPEDMSASFARRLEGWRAAGPEERPAAADDALSGIGKSMRPWLATRIGELWSRGDPDGCADWLVSLPEDQAVAALGSWMRETGDPGKTLEIGGHLPLPMRRKFLVMAFDQWSGENSARPEDFGTWPDSRRQAWEDLEALRALSDRGNAEGTD